MTNKFQPAQFAAHMLQNNIIEIHEKGFPIRGVKTRSPVFINSMELVQREMLGHIAEAMTYDLPWNTHVVAGSRFGTLIMSEVARLGGYINLPIMINTHGGIGGLKKSKIEGKNVLLVTDVIGTGTHASEAVQLIKNYGGICENIYTVFDYGFHLTNNTLRDVTIKSILTFKQLAASRVAPQEETEIMQNWITEHNSCFGTGNRKKVVGMASVI